MPRRIAAAPGPTDAELVQRLRAGDEGALAFVIDREFDDVADFAFHIVRREALARDIAQDTFVRCWERCGSLTPDTTIRGYLFRVARNLALDALRRDAREGRLEREVANIYAVHGAYADNEGVARAEYHELRALLDQVAVTLTPRVREVLLLYLDQQLTPAEIAEAMETAPTTVYKQLRAGLARYVDALAGRWP